MWDLPFEEAIHDTEREEANDGYCVAEPRDPVPILCLNHQLKQNEAAADNSLGCRCSTNVTCHLALVESKISVRQIDTVRTLSLN